MRKYFFTFKIWKVVLMLCKLSITLFWWSYCAWQLLLNYYCSHSVTLLSAECCCCVLFHILFRGCWGSINPRHPRNDKGGFEQRNETVTVEWKQKTQISFFALSVIIYDSFLGRKFITIIRNRERNTLLTRFKSIMEI